MSPLKFEDHIKEKLEQRNITPSANAWSKLEAELDVQSKSSKKKYSWLVVSAAACIMFLLMLTPFLSFLNKVDPNMQTVEVIVPDDEFSPTTIQDAKLVENFDKEEIKATNSTSVKVEKYNEATYSKRKNKVVYVQSEIALIKKQEVEVNSTEITSFQHKKAILIEDSLVIQKAGSKITKMLVHEEGIEKNNAKVTGEDIEGLLRKAQLEITTDKLLSEEKLNALSLLEDVESELDETFKEQVFEVLKTSFGKLRTAVVERDN